MLRGSHLLALGLLAIGGLLAVGFAACKASVKGELHTGDEEGDFVEPAGADGVPTARAVFEQEVDGQYALLGARHDLALAGDSLQPTCSCLAVALGYPTNPAFFWTSVQPSVNPGTQLVIAFTSEGVACERPAADSLGASYWGYRMVNDDVIVFVENARYGRPVTSGAIIPAPRAGGAVYIEPIDGKVPYGRPLDGSGKRCRVDVSAASPQVVPPPPHTTDETTPASSTPAGSDGAY